MHDIIEQLKADMHYAEIARDSCDEHGKLQNYYHGKIVAYRHAIKRMQEAIDKETAKCTTSES